MPVLTAELHNSDELDVALARARADYLEMPGLRLTSAQAARLWALDDHLCRIVLSALVDTRFLTRSSGATFLRT